MSRGRWKVYVFHRGYVCRNRRNVYESIFQWGIILSQRKDHFLSEGSYFELTKGLFFDWGITCWAEKRTIFCVSLILSQQRDHFLSEGSYLSQRKDHFLSEGSYVEPTKLQRTLFWVTDNVLSYRKDHFLSDGSHFEPAKGPLFERGIVFKAKKGTTFWVKDHIVSQ